MLGLDVVTNNIPSKMRKKIKIKLSKSIVLNQIVKKLKKVFLGPIREFLT